MIPNTLCKKVVIIGPEHKKPRGGIAQTLLYYDQYVFENMVFIDNSGKGRFHNVMVFLKAIYLQFKLLIFNQNIRIIHIHTASNLSFVRSYVFQLISHLMKRRVIMHIHGGGFKAYYDNGHIKFVKNVLSSTDAIIALTPKWVKIFSSDLDLNNVFFIHNVIPKPTLQTVINDDKIHILFMGLITKSKGIFDFVQVLNTIDTTIKDKIIFHICGNGEVNRLLSMIDELNLSNNVIFEGWITGEKKVALLNQCEILVQPSYIEALSLSILEGMSYKMAIIATNVGGIPSIVTDSYNGYLVEPGDIKSMKHKIEILVTDSNLRNRMCINSQNCVQAYYADNVSIELSNLYESLM